MTRMQSIDNAVMALSPVKPASWSDQCFLRIVWVLRGWIETPGSPIHTAPRTPKKRNRALSNGGEQNSMKVSIL